MSTKTARADTTNPYYPDIQVFLVLIPLINAFNYYLTYSNIQFNGFLALTFTIDTIQGYVAWWGVRSFILYLDKKWSYEHKTALRILFQIVCSTFLGLLIIATLTEVTSLIAKGETAPLHFYTIDLFIISIWFLVINGIYIGLHYYRKWQKSEALLREQNRVQSEGFIIKVGTKNLQFNFDKLLGFYVEDNYITMCTVDGKKYYLDQSLNEIEDKLPEQLFFRLNRQHIVHRQTIAGFRRIKNGKLKALIGYEDLLPSEISVSRTKAPPFKSWFEPK